MKRALSLVLLLSSAALAQPSPESQPPVRTEYRKVTVIDFEDVVIDTGPGCEPDINCCERRKPRKLVRLPEDFRDKALDALPAR